VLESPRRLLDQLFNTSQSGLIAESDVGCVTSSLAQRISRCLVVSVGTTLLSAAVLVALTLGAGVPAGMSNVIAVCCGIVPSYFANRSWVWAKTGRSSVVREIAPFWVLSLAGLGASTVAVARVASFTRQWSTSLRAIALPAANLSVFGVLWIVQFVLLDRVLFAPTPREPESADVMAQRREEMAREYDRNQPW
jgi:putative flippase GtrA